MKPKPLLIYFLYFFILFFIPSAMWAENIDAIGSGARYAWGENIGWINLKPSFGPGVTVTDTSLTGYAWGENIGWINFSPANYGGVVNLNGTGTLQGYAWGENVGWIKFNPTGGGVFIDACGDFNGTAWGENIGWISFRSNGANPFRLRTSWLSPLDAIAPVTTYSPALQPWYTADTIFSLAATDCGTAVKELRYSFNGGTETITSGTTATATVTAEGCNSFSYYAIDSNSPANVEGAKLLNVCIDRNPPVITLTAPADSGIYYINTPATPAYTVIDTVSQVSGTATVGQFTTTQKGNYDYTVTASDNAGNIASVTHNYTVAFPGNVDPADTGCQYAWAENVGWINFKPSWGPGVTVTDSAVTGKAWGENIGWINFSPANYGGVVNLNGTGNLQGYAWGENVGWINFKPNQGPGVTIDADGKFHGYAWGENIGWINFSAAQSCVKTAWVVPNRPPVAQGQAVTTAEDTATAIVLIATDDPLTYSVVTPPAHGILSGLVPNLTYSPAANYNGPDSFTFKANDGTSDSNIATVSITVTAVNDAPVANSQTVTTAEDTPLAITLTAADVENDPLVFSIVTPPVHGTLSGLVPNLTYAPAANYNGPDSFTFKANDGQADSTIATVSITVTPVNDPPLVGAITGPIEPVPIGTVINVSASFSDVDLLDSHTARWTWDDGTPTAAGTVDESNGTVTGSHSYSTPGVYTVTLTVTDNGGSSAQAIFQYIVVYDPSAGFVTGGGWITSPPGAYTADPALTGKATFGFVAKYKKGASIPTGETEFQFRVANLKFNSSSYDWLVVAGAKAQYKGVGTINGTGSFRFMLTAIDGALVGGSKEDKFRIKIWDTATEQLVYDNLLGAVDSADPTTVVGGGSIVIHK